MKKTFFSIALLGLLASCGGNAVSTQPEWLEPDSLAAINNRIENDFSLTMYDAVSQIQKLYSGVDVEDIERYIASKQLEVREINGERRMHRKSPGNLKLLCSDFGREWAGRGADATQEEILWVDSVVDSSKGLGELSNTLYVKYRFSIDVPRHDFLLNDTLKVWMPLPIESDRQSDVKILSASHDYELSAGNSEHNTLFFAVKVDENTDSVLHFEYEGEYKVSAQYFSPQYIRQNIKEYDHSSEFYKRYTSFQAPHIVRLDSLAASIVKDEKSPFLQSEKVFDYIVQNYPWAGAREYSTIECIPQYVLDEKHGDCGQVALLYISLMRTLGVPARWESGWMLHPGQKNLHDWAEVYYEGVGWVPVDVSFGRYTSSENVATQKFYSTGMDKYRFATNKGVGDALYPPKKFLRSETVDFQVGEVECGKGNLFYPGWKKKLEILEIHSVVK